MISFLLKDIYLFFTFQLTYQQSLEQYKRQLNKVNLERRNATASADAMRALLQRKLESAQVR